MRFVDGIGVGCLWLRECEVSYGKANWFSRFYRIPPVWFRWCISDYRAKVVYAKARFDAVRLARYDSVGVCL